MSQFPVSWVSLLLEALNVVRLPVRGEARLWVTCNLLGETTSCTTSSHARGAFLCLQLMPPCLTGLGWTAGAYHEGLLYLRGGATLAGVIPAWGFYLYCT